MSELYVLTLVASDKPLGKSIIGAIDLTLTENGVVEADERTWLAEDKAIDFFLTSKPSQKCMDDIKTVLEVPRVDHFIQQQEGRRKRLLVADMDSTIIAEETLDEIAGKLGLKPMVSAITERTMRGELDFETSLRKRVALLSGKSSDVLETVRAEMHFNEGAQILVQTMKRHGALCVLVSGGFTYFTSYVAEQCGFHHHHSNDLKIKDRKITGFVGEPILGQRAKLSFMEEYMAQKRLKARDVMAVGDGANDLDMITSAHKGGGLGVGYYPKPALEEVTQNIIRYGNLTAALFAQGYKENEFRRRVSHNTMRIKKNN